MTSDQGTNGSNGDVKLVDTEDELTQFDEVFPEIVRFLTDKKRNREVVDASKWYKQVLEYNVPYGKKNRGMTVVQCYKLLAAKSDQTDEMLLRVRILGWCVEILQAYFLVADDVMDQSETRRGQLCWYKKNNVGLMAINDALYLENCIFEILHEYFHDHPSYPHLLHLFHKISYHTITGQTLDMLYSSSDASDPLSNYTQEKYDSIVKYKTAYYSFYLPVALAMHVSAECSERDFEVAQDILLDMGHYFQVQDDYLDCYGDVSVTGKVGTDIQEAKCSWLVVQAIKLAKEEQKKTLETCYGKSDSDSVRRVKGVYKDLSLEEAYRVYEEDSYARIMSKIAESCSDTLPADMFIKLTHKIYRRKK